MSERERVTRDMVSVIWINNIVEGRKTPNSVLLKDGGRIDLDAHPELTPQFEVLMNGYVELPEDV